MAQFGTHVEDDLVLLDNKLKQLKNEYEQYFLGSRKREPHLLRGEVDKMVRHYANTSIQNTGLRFRFNNLRSRFFTFRRHWDDILRKIEQGRYERHIFKAKLRDREQGESAGRTSPAPVSEGSGSGDLFDSLIAARQACGQETSGITPEKLSQLVRSQEVALREKYGCKRVAFRVVVEAGKAKLRATPQPD